MNTLVSFLFDVLLLLGGYGFARLQLRGRFGLAKDAIEDAETEIAAARYRELKRDKEIKEWKDRVVLDMRQWKAGLLQEFSLSMSTPRCPDGYSAKQVLGYKSVGALPYSPQYPGGFRAWDAAHGIPVREGEEKEW